MLFKEIITVYAENHSIPINTKCILIYCWRSWYIQLPFGFKRLNFTFLYPDTPIWTSGVSEVLRAQHKQPGPVDTRPLRNPADGHAVTLIRQRAFPTTLPNSQVRNRPSPMIILQYATRLLECVYQGAFGSIYLQSTLSCDWEIQVRMQHIVSVTSLFISMNH
jgi:hypothetical protein